MQQKSCFTVQKYHIAHIIIKYQSTAERSLLRVGMKRRIKASKETQVIDGFWRKNSSKKIIFLTENLWFPRSSKIDITILTR